MPTTRPRHQITETPEIARALDAAARRWPGEPRSRLLVHLVRAGSDALQDSRANEAAERRAALDRLANDYSDLYPDGYLAELRADWPT